MKGALSLFLLITAVAAVEAAYADEASQGKPAGIEAIPKVKKFVKASYSEEAIRLGIEGTVKLEITIGKSGLVDSARILSGLHPDLDSSALQAVRQFEFSPAMAGGQAIPVAIEYGYAFSMDSLVSPIEQYVNFKGRLREKGTRSSIGDAMVIVEILDTAMDRSLKIPFGTYMRKIGGFSGQSLEEGKLVTMTDSQGFFAFKSLPACSLRVSFPVSGYKLESFTESILPGQQINMDYRIRRESYDEYEIVVYGKAEKKEVSRTTLSVSEIKRVPGFGGDAITVVRALPGVARNSFGSNEIVIRGSGPQDTKYLLDGVNIFRLFHFGDFGAVRSVYSSDLLSAIDMYPSGFGTRYGGAIGGIVEVKGRPAKTDRWHGKADISLLDTRGMVEGPLPGGMALQVSGTYSYIGDVIKAATEGQATTVAPLYRDAYARLDWNQQGNHRGFLTYSTSKDELEIITPDVRGGSDELTQNASRGLADDWFQMGLVGLDSKLGSSLKNELRLSLVQGDALGSFFGLAGYGMESRGFNLRDELQYAQSKYVTFKPGLDLSYEEFRFHYEFSTKKGVVDERDKFILSTLGGYANLEIKPAGNWMIIPGVRYDYYPDVKEGRTSLRMNSRWEYRKGLAIKGSAGTYSQSPKFAGVTVEGIGNPDLPPTEAIHFVAGHEWQINDLISLDAQAYYNTQTKIPNATDSLDPVTGKDLNYVPDMDGRMYGLELMLRHDQGKRFFGWASYSLSRSERRAGGPFAPDLYTANDDWDPDKWIVDKNDQTHSLQMVGGWRLFRNWEYGFRFRYVTGNPASPLRSITDNEFVYDSDLRAYVPKPGKPFSDRVDPFLQLDIRIDKRFVYNSWMLSTYLDVNNVNYFFYNSPEFYGYNYDNSERKAVGAIFFPSIGLTAEF